MTLSTLYLVALGVFCVVMLAALFEAVASVSRKPVWHASPFTVAAAAHPVQSLLLQRPAAVDARHSNFAGLTNNDEFKMTA